MDEGPQLSAASFRAIRELIFSLAGIAMTDEKEELVKARLAKRLRELRIDDYDKYLARIRSDRVELSNMVDVLTTNKTSFFREPAHFDYLVEHVFPAWRESGAPRRVWSAGCSSGEEPYTLGMLFCEHVPGIDIRILATDLSTRVLTRAKAARYSAATVESVPTALRARYLRSTGKPGEPEYEVRPVVTSLVSFARLNLMGEWGMRGKFDLIFCRNVMIYFNDDIRAMLGRRFAAQLAPDGVLMIGHAETIASLDQPLRLVRPAIYVQ